MAQQHILRTVERPGLTSDHQSVALGSYLHAVGAHLDRRGLSADSVCVFPATPHRALSASMTLRCAGTGVVRSSGWHEELGWWVGDGDSGPDTGWTRPCWMGELLPAAARVAELLETAVRCGVGRGAPARVLRYRSADERSLLAELARAIG